MFSDFFFDSWVYRKTTLTGLMLNFSGICPETWKRGSILCLLNIAKQICSNDELFKLETDKLRDMFKLNGYPIYYFNKILNKFLNPTINDNLNASVEDNFIIIKIPFIGDYSYQLSKKLKKLIEDSNNCNVRIVFTSFKIRNYFSLKAKTPKHLLSNVVYKFSCQNDSELSYIGETKRHLVIRAGEHLDLENSNKNTEVKTHIKGCIYCKNHVNVDSFEVIKKCFNNFDTLIHEALIIRKNDPKLNKQLYNKGTSFTLKLDIGIIAC